jgi:hypothetical protein
VAIILNARKEGCNFFEKMWPDKCHLQHKSSGGSFCCTGYFSNTDCTTSEIGDEVTVGNTDLAAKHSKTLTNLLPWSRT